MISLIISGLVLAIILSFLVFIHELGHFIVAKRSGVRVEEFGFGYPPRIIRLAKRGGTEYSLNWIPFGGFVRLYGHEVRGEGDRKEARRKGAFWAQSFRNRSLTILGGVVMNFVLGVAAFAVIYSLLGIPVETDKVIVVGLEPDSAAVKAGLRIEDLILNYEIDGEVRQIKDPLELADLGENSLGKTFNLRVEREGKEKNLKLILPEKEKIIVSMLATDSPAKTVGLKEDDVIEKLTIKGEGQEFASLKEFIDLIEANRGTEVELGVLRGAESLTLRLVPRENPPAGQGPLGVSLAKVDLSQLAAWELPFRGSWAGDFAVTSWGVALDTIELGKFPVWQMPFRGVWAGLRQTVSLSLILFKGVGRMAKDLVVGGKVPADVAGPVGILYFSLKTDLLRQGLLVVLNFLGIVSVNLAIINLMPLPGLDGYWLTFLGLERLLKDKFKPKYERWASIIGMATVGLLIISISIKDIGVVISDEEVRRWAGQILVRLRSW